MLVQKFLAILFSIFAILLLVQPLDPFTSKVGLLFPLLTTGMGTFVAILVSFGQYLVFPFIFPLLAIYLASEQTRQNFKGGFFNYLVEISFLLVGLTVFLTISSEVIIFGSIVCSFAYAIFMHVFFGLWVNLIDGEVIFYIQLFFIAQFFYLCFKFLFSSGNLAKLQTAIDSTGGAGIIDKILRLFLWAGALASAFKVIAAFLFLSYVFNSMATFDLAKSMPTAVAALLVSVVPYLIVSGLVSWVTKYFKQKNEQILEVVKT